MKWVSSLGAGKVRARQMHRANFQLDQLHSKHTLLLPPDAAGGRARSVRVSLGTAACRWMLLGRTSPRQVF